MTNAPDLCPEGCYWQCEHRGPAASEREGRDRAFANRMAAFDLQASYVFPDTSSRASRAGYQFGVDWADVRRPLP